MPSNPASPKPANPDTPRGIRASKHPSIPDCRNPLFDHLKGVTARCKPGPQGISGRQTSSPHMLPFAPLGPQLDAPACTGVPNSSFEHPVSPSRTHMPPKAFQVVTHMNPRAPKWSPRRSPSKPKGTHREQHGAPSISSSVTRVLEVGGKGGSL